MDKRKVATEQATTTNTKPDAKIQNSADTAKILQKKNYVQMIGEELAKMDNDDVSGKYGIFVCKSANQVLAEASRRPDPKNLWLKLWYEGELCCLYAPSEAGKSIYAVQIADAIAKEKRVLYFDFELSEKQFQLRYTNQETKRLYSFPSNFYHVEIDTTSPDADNEETILKGIEEMAIATNTDVIIIDNITWICADSEKGDIAAQLMKRLMRLKKTYGWSILVLAHTPKRGDYEPIAKKDLAGSSHIFNFIDSAFAIGTSIKGEEYRYIKEMKGRDDKKTYGASNVINCVIEKTDNFVNFKKIGYSNEIVHIQQQKNKTKNLLEENNTDSRFFASILQPGKTYLHKDLLDLVMRNRRKPNGQSYGRRSCIAYIKDATPEILEKFFDDDNREKYRLSAKVQS